MFVGGALVGEGGDWAWEAWMVVEEHGAGIRGGGREGAVRGKMRKS